MADRFIALSVDSRGRTRGTTDAMETREAAARALFQQFPRINKCSTSRTNIHAGWQECHRDIEWHARHVVMKS